MRRAVTVWLTIMFNNNILGIIFGHRSVISRPLLQRACSVFWAGIAIRLTGNLNKNPAVAKGRRP